MKKKERERYTRGRRWRSMKVDDESRCTILKGIWQIYRVKNNNSTEEVGWRQKKTG